MEYTKGKWKITEWNDKRGFNIFTDDTFIASVPLSQANANLISAAPDMYEVCKALVKELELHTTQWDLGMKKLSAQGIQAITKAEGK